MPLLSSPREHLTWNRMAGLRWSGASSARGVEVQVDWRWEVATWPIATWLTWRRRCDELMPERAKLAEIRAVERRAYEEMTGVGMATREPGS